MDSRMEAAEGATALAVAELVELFPPEKREEMRKRLRAAILSAVMVFAATTCRSSRRIRVEPSAN